LAGDGIATSFDRRLAKITDVRKSSRAKRQPPPVAKPKELFWIGSALKDFEEFPAAIRPQVGFNLRFAQNGESGEDVKVLQGFGSANVKEIVSNTQGDTFRTVYTIEFERGLCAALLSKEVASGQSNR
jgi:phage-related protein